MKIFISKKVYCILGIMAMFTSFPSLADKCGKNDRVSMPQCSRAVSLGTEGEVEVFNLCSAMITVKLDVSGARDKRVNIKPGYGKKVDIGTTKKFTGRVGQYEQVNRYFSAKCCPRYSRCGFSNEKPVPSSGSARDAWSYAKAAKDDPRFKGFQ